jgi:hypothetical protein
MNNNIEIGVVKKLGHQTLLYFLLVVMAAVTIFPLLFVGFTTFDDMNNSINFGKGTGLFETAEILAEIQGRIGFFWFYPLLRVPYVIDGSVWYLATKYGSLLGLLAALHYMVVKVMRSTWVALLSLLLFLALVQNGWDHNALTSYPFAFSFIATLFLVSIGLFAAAIDQKRIGLAMMAGLLYFFTLASELFVLFFPFYLVLLARGRQSGESYHKLIRSRWIYISPVLFCLVAYLILYVVLRALHPSIYDGNSWNAMDVMAAGKVVGAYSLTAFPLASLHFFASPAHQAFFMDSTGLQEILADLNSAHYIKPICVGLMFYWLMSSVRFDLIERKLFHTSVVLAFFGIFLPNLLLGFVQKHQNWVASGSYSYLYTFYSFLSAIILMALLSVLLHIKSLTWQPWIRKTLFSILALSLAIVTFAVDVRNNYITKDQKLSHRKWQLMDVVINSPAFAEVVDGSVIVAPTLTSHQRGIAATPSLYWSKYVKKKTGRNIQFLDDGCKENVPCYFLVFRQESHSDNQFVVFGKSARGDHRVSYDVVFYSLPSRGANFIIGHYESGVASPLLSINNSTVTNMGGGSFAAELRSAPVSGRTRIARLTGNVGIFLDQITVANYNVAPSFQPLSIQLGVGFYGWETNLNEPSWSWGKEVSELLVINNSKQNMVAKVGIEVTSFENLNLRVMGLQEKLFAVVPGKYAPIEVAIELLPGENKLKMISDRPAIKPPGGGDQRMLSFAVRNLRIQSK